jgi:hypothetical protein
MKRSYVQNNPGMGRSARSMYGSIIHTCKCFNSKSGHWQVPTSSANDAHDVSYKQDCCKCKNVAVLCGSPVTTTFDVIKASTARIFLLFSVRDFL